MKVGVVKAAPLLATREGEIVAYLKLWGRGREGVDYMESPEYF